MTVTIFVGDGFVGDGWPNAQQELLIQACIWNGDDALRAWRKWQSATQTQAPDPESTRLLPLLCHRLAALGVADVELAAYRESLRMNWFRNRLMFREMERIIQLFHQNGVQTLILKGAALALTAYDHIGLRVMNDFDVLVPLASAQQAVDLVSSDWTPLSYVPNPQTMRYKHSAGYTRRGPAKSYQFDLHWHPIEENIDAGLDAVFWQGAETIALSAAVSTQVLCPADQLLHICVHGLRSDQEIQRFRWVVDAAQILRTGRVDWERLQEQTLRRQVIMPMRVALRYLAETMHQPIPAAVIERFATATVDPQLVREFETKLRQQTPVRRLQVHWFHYRRINPEQSPALATPGFIAYLQARWGINNLGDMINLLKQIRVKR